MTDLTDDVTEDELTDDELSEFERNAEHLPSGPITLREIRPLLAEIGRRRAAQVADAARVRAVVRTHAMTGVCEAIGRMMGPTYWYDNPSAHDTFAKVADDIADRAAAQLTGEQSGEVAHG